MRLRSSHAERHTQTRSVPYVDEAMLHDRVRQAFDDVIPPVWLAIGVLEGDKVLRHSSRHMDVGSESKQTVEDAMRRDGNPVQVGVLCDPLQFRNTADVLRVRPNDVNRLLLNQVLEVLPQIDLLARVNGD